MSLVLLVTGVTLLFIRSTLAQTKPSDSEMKEVVRLLLESERELELGEFDYVESSRTKLV